MRKNLQLILIFCFGSFLFSSLSAEKVKIKYFYKTTCKACLKFKKEIMPKLKSKYGGQTEWSEFEVTENKNALIELYNLSTREKRKSLSIPSISVGGKLLSGVDEISKNFENALLQAKQNLENPPLKSEGKNLKQIYKDISLFAILISGLIDGVNPCAFAVIIFFISFLSVYGYSRKEIILVGSSYCIAVFLAYLLLGLGLFKALYMISGFYTVMKVFYYAMAGLCFAFFAFSIYDFFKYKKTGTSEGLLLQLPKTFKLTINKIFGKYLRGKSDKNPIGLVLASLVVGFLVSLVEAVCTGQIYVPVLSYILKDPALKTKAFFYLVLYNIMFVVPLLAVFVLAVLGHQSKSFNNFLKQHLGLLKILMAAVFLGLGIMLLASM